MLPCPLGRSMKKSPEGVKATLRLRPRESVPVITPPLHVAFVIVNDACEAPFR